MITFKELESQSYNTKLISNKQLCGTCQKCKNDFVYSQVKKFLKNRLNKPEKIHLWQTCQKCWLKINTCEDKKWIKKNSDAQKISQNTPEQLQKNRDGVRKSWNNKRRKSASDILKEKWKNDEAFAKTALLNLNKQNAKIGFGTGGLKGYYNNIYYDSALELSFIIWCLNKKIKIKRYDFDPVEYIDENEIKRNYYPDFIINNNEIVEIKGSGLWYRKNYKRNLLKIEAAKIKFDSYIIIFDKDETVTRYYKTARKIHNETYKKENH